MMVEGYLMPGTPTLTNVGRYPCAYSSCVVIPVDLREPGASVRQEIISYYRQNMGSGFDFSPYKEPIDLLVWVNQLSAEESAGGRYDRYIGNMGSLHISHPKILEFIKAKQGRNLEHFNISPSPPVVGLRFYWKLLLQLNQFLASLTGVD